MYNWKKWIWPGVITSVVLTAGTAFIKTEPIQGELSSGATNQLTGKHSWANVDISGRDITLSGTAPSQEAVAEASKIASEVYGVRVVNQKTELLALVKPYTLTAEKKDGKLTVSGFAPNDAERENILSAAKESSGGLEVVDDITLARGNPENVSGINAYAIGALSGLAAGTAKISDTAISVTGNANEVADYQGTLDYLTNVPSGVEIASQDIKPATISPYTFNAVKSAGKVSLEGFVPSFETKDAVGEKFASVNPGTTIENNLKIALGAPQGADWPKATADFSGILSMLENGSVSVNDADVTYEGKLPKGGTLDAFNAAVKGDSFKGLNIAGISIVEPAIEQEEEPTIPTVSPYLWIVSKEDGKISVSGSVTSDEERASVVEAAKSTFGVSEVDDQQTLGLGSPDGYDAARTALSKGLKFLDSGQATVVGTETNLVGIAKNNNVKNLVGKVVQKALPSGYSVNLDITSPESSAQAGGDVEFIAVPTADPYIWGVSKSAEGIILSGNVTSDDERSSVLESVKSAFGGLAVEDQQTLALGKPDGLDAVRTGLSKGLKLLETGAAKVVGTNIIVSGAAKNNNIKTLATKLLTKAVPESYNMDVAIRAPESEAVKAGDVKPAPTIPTADPYIWGVSKSDVKVTVFGNITSDEERSSVIDSLNSVFAGQAIQDNQSIALGKPEGLDGIREAISKGVKFLETGTARVIGSDVKVFGKAKNNNIKNLATNVLLKGIPYEYGLDLDIKAPKSAAVTAGDVQFVAKAPEPAQTKADACTADVKKLIDGQIIRFETNSSEFLPESRDLVNTLAGKLNECSDISVKAEGHTDSVGSSGYNLRLSNDRAHKIKKYLISKGIKPSRIKAKGFGETKPIASNDTDEGRAQNRRTLISIIE